jgi:paraquat-inducible protein B
MGKKANPAVIGGFVVGALILAIAGVLVFGSGKFFADTTRGVMYFEGNLKGLRVGASVDFQGVQLGTVTEIRAVFDTKEVRARIPVIIEIRRDNVEWEGERPEGGALFRRLIERGMRAQLQLESMVTGQLFIQLDFHPDSPAVEPRIDPLTKLPEIPTIPTTLQQVQQTIREAMEKIGDLPLEEIVKNLNDTLQGIDRLVNAPEVMDAVRNLNTAMTDVQQLLRNVNKQVEPMSASVTDAMGSIGNLARNADGHVAALTGSLNETVGAARVALENAQVALKSVNEITSPNSPVGYELVKTLRELSTAARALRVLADYLERNPNSVIFGRTEAKVQ